jgi:hypoxanthine phosphoribosyltransferase
MKNFLVLVVDSIFFVYIIAKYLMIEKNIERVLIHEQTIMSRLDQLGSQIASDYKDKELTVVAILNGSLIFMADLLRRINIPLKVDCWSVSSYHGVKSSGKINFRQQTIADVDNRHVLLLDDILDSGLTLKTIKDKLLTETKALDVKTCVLLNKDVKRSTDVEADYKGFDIGDEFVVGYGLDYNQHYRNLPYIGVYRV